MKIAFVFPSFEALSIEVLSASLKKAGHETSLFFDPSLFDDTFLCNRRLAKLFDKRDAVARDVAEWRPDLVAFSVLTDIYPWAAEMASRIKKLNPVPVVMGGIHATSVPDIIIQNPDIDFVIQGEGDHALVELASRLEAGADVGDIANVWSKRDGEVEHVPPRPLIRDLDSLPFSDKSIYDGTFTKGLGIYTMLASRGCPYRCTYCNAGLLKSIYADEKGSFWRARSVDNVIEELQIAGREGRVEIINFYDEVFGADIRWLREFAPKFRSKINKPFLACSHPGHVTEEYAGLLKEAGCIKVDLGVQSTDPELRRKILKRYETNEQIANAIDNFMKAGIFLHVENIFNLPGQNVENTAGMVRFYNEHRPNCVKIFGLRIFPRTPIEQAALEMGLLTKEDVERNWRGINDLNQSLYMGGSLANRDLFAFQTVLAFLPVLPPKWITHILDKELYRHLPRNPGYMAFLARLITKQKWEEDISKRSYAHRYKYYISRWIKEKMGFINEAPL